MRIQDWRQYAQDSNAPSFNLKPAYEIAFKMDELFLRVSTWKNDLSKPYGYITKIALWPVRIIAHILLAVASAFLFAVYLLPGIYMLRHCDESGLGACLHHLGDVFMNIFEIINPVRAYDRRWNEDCQELVTVCDKQVLTAIIDGHYFDITDDGLCDTTDVMPAMKTYAQNADWEKLQSLVEAPGRTNEELGYAIEVAAENYGLKFIKDLLLKSDDAFITYFAGRCMGSEECGPLLTIFRAFSELNKEQPRFQRIECLNALFQAFRDKLPSYLAKKIAGALRIFNNGEFVLDKNKKEAMSQVAPLFIHTCYLEWLLDGPMKTHLESIADPRIAEDIRNVTIKRQLTNIINFSQYIVENIANEPQRSEALARRQKITQTLDPILIPDIISIVISCLLCAPPPPRSTVKIEVVPEEAKKAEPARS